MASDRMAGAVRGFRTDRTPSGTTGTAVRVCRTGPPTVGVDYH